ncbi:PilZ domain-containing protein [Sphingomonas sp. HITSZ_GF]|uniref:PilZ domain-containing protein n=1 Tax=Sphingomonas sp. HITSZ_GF TaxID=3037247 RepID=UPI00240DD56B|nr:PilZ domain-containing protein [Sphingomonas sp. HITSZ_GF]
MRPRDERHSVLIRGRMRSGGPMVDVCVRNVSKNGMMLQAPEAPRRGDYVEVRLQEDTIVGQVVWSSDRRFGIRTRDRVPVWRLLGRPSPIERGTGGERLNATRAAAARAHSESRYFGRAAEFLILALAVTAVAGFFAFMGYEALASLTTQIKTHL